MPRPRPQSTPPSRFPDDIGSTLVCPQCRTPVHRDGERFVCRNADCRRVYLIDDGIPRFLVSEATILDAADWRKIIAVEL